MVKSCSKKQMDVAGPLNKEDSIDLPIKVIRAFDCKQGAVRAVRYNVDGNYCMTCGSDKSVKLWNPDKGLLMKTYTGHGLDVFDVCGSCDNSQLTSCGADKSVMYWDVGSGQIIRRYRGHVAKVNCVQFNEESTLIISGSVDSSVRVWDCKSRGYKSVQVMKEAKDSITSIQVTDHEIMTSSVDGKVRRYDVRMGKMYSDNIGHPVTCAKFTKDSQCILASSHDNSIRLLDITNGEMLGEYKGHKNSKYMIECGLSLKDDHVISGSEDGTIYFWDLIQANVVKKVNIKSKGRTVHSISHHPEQNALLVASEKYVFTLRLPSYIEDEL